MKDFQYLKNVATLRLNDKVCIGCGRCIEVCPHGVFAIEKKKARIVDFDACIECGACSKNCPVAAITVAAGVGCALGMINEWLQELNLPRTGGGC